MRSGALVASLPQGATVLEVGSGTGRDAGYVEPLGARVGDGFAIDGQGPATS